MGRHQAAPRGEESTHNRRRNRERRICHNPKWPPRKPEVTGIDLNDGHRAASESLSKLRRSPWVEFDRNDPGARGDQLRRERTRSGADVEYEVAGPDTGIGDNQAGPLPIELVPSPQWPGLPGHGAS
jgi:hypothetical protein